MAVSCILCGVLRISYYNLSQVERHARIISHHVQQLRFKSGNRTRAPHVAVDKDWIYKKRKVITQVAEVIDLKPFAEDDVWLSKYYNPLEHNVVKAIQMQRETCHVAMLNSPNTTVNLSLMLDLRTKKTTKFMQVIKNTLVLPHDFDDGMKNEVMVFVKNENGRKIAEDLGAKFIGGTELVKLIDAGEVRRDEFSHVVCHVDMMTDISTTRKFLRDLYPSPKNGNLGGDLRKMVSLFVSGKTYESVKLEDAVGKVKIILGTLNMPDDHLMSNFDTYMESICAHRSPNLGQFITKGTLTCPPSREEFLISPSLLRPVHEREQQVAKLEQEEEEVLNVKDEESDDEELEAKRKKNK